MHELQAELQRFKRDTQYYEAHREALLTQYPEQWVEEGASSSATASAEGRLRPFLWRRPCQTGSGQHGLLLPESPGFSPGCDVKSRE